jgi:hypothetical protein
VFRRSIEWFGGSVAVYLVVAACGSYADPIRPKPSASAGTGGAATAGTEGLGGMVVAEGGSGSGMATDAGAGRSSAGRGSAGEGVAGTIMSPVRDASAQEGGGPGTCECPEPEPYVPPEPEVVVVPCSDRWTELSRSEEGYWLDRTVAFGALPVNDQRIARGYTETPVVVARAAGKVGASCVDEPVRFVLFPR